MNTTRDLSVWDVRGGKWITFMVSPTQKDCVEFHYYDTGENSVDDYVGIVYKSHVTGYLHGYLSIPVNDGPVNDGPVNDGSEECTLNRNQYYECRITEARKIWNWLLKFGWKPETGRVSGF